MSATYEPGTVAVATVRGVPNVRVIRCREYRDCWFMPNHMTSEDGNGWWPEDEEVTDVRPLVVLDLPKGALAGWPVLVDALRVAREKTGYRLVFDGLIDQIEAQTRPPKPPEPGKYGAVIAGDGREWFRYTTSERQGRDWCRPGTEGGTEYARWEDLSVLRVTNEGVQS